MSIPQNPDHAFESRILREISSNASPDLDVIQDDPAIYGRQIQASEDGGTDTRSVIVGSPNPLAFEDEVIERVDNESRGRELLAFIEQNSSSDIERKILKMRWGLGEFVNMAHTLESVSQECGVSRERIRQIEQKTLARLRHPDNRANLRGFLDSN